MGNFERFGLQNEWYDRLRDHIDSEYFTQLQIFIELERRHHEVFPAAPDVFTALNETSWSDTRVVILGQDPYHGLGQAHGLCFSVQHGAPIPPSLANIFKELEHDLGITSPNHGCLIHWAQQGVLLLNTTLTVRRGEPNSHEGKGWEKFTDHIISLVNAKDHPVAFVLWGARAQAKKTLIRGTHHLVIEAPHPSPLSAYRGFFGSRPFSRINDFLIANDLPPISWDLANTQ